MTVLPDDGKSLTTSQVQSFRHNISMDADAREKKRGKDASENPFLRA